MIQIIRYFNEQQKAQAIEYFELRGNTRYDLDDDDVFKDEFSRDCIQCSDGEWVNHNYAWNLKNHSGNFSEINLYDHVAVIPFSNSDERDQAVKFAENRGYTNPSRAPLVTAHNAVFLRKNKEWVFGVKNVYNSEVLNLLLYPLKEIPTPLIYTHITRDGLKARIIGERKHNVQPIVAAYLNDNKEGVETIITLSQNLKVRDHKESAHDLFEVASVRIQVYQSNQNKSELIAIHYGMEHPPSLDKYSLIDDYVKQYTI